MPPISMTNVYHGSLRTEAIHLKSGTVLTTDAPTDNKGKGEAFSPTDLVCVALSSCMLTTMGIYANAENIDLKGMRTTIVKIMGSDPRKIAEIQVDLYMDGLKASPEQIEKLKEIAHTCPVALSLSNTLKQTVNFFF